jgi:hypothetical protein
MSHCEPYILFVMPHKLMLHTMLCDMSHMLCYKIRNEVAKLLPQTRSPPLHAMADANPMGLTGPPRRPGGSRQGCLNGHPTVKFTVRTSACVCNYPMDAFLPADAFLPSAPIVKNVFARRCARTSAQTSSPPCPRPPSLPLALCGRADVSARTRGKKNIKKIIF